MDCIPLPTDHWLFQSINTDVERLISYIYICACDMESNVYLDEKYRRKWTNISHLSQLAYFCFYSSGSGITNLDTT